MVIVVACCILILLLAYTTRSNIFTRAIFHGFDWLGVDITDGYLYPIVPYYLLEKYGIVVRKKGMLKNIASGQASPL